MPKTKTSESSTGHDAFRVKRHGTSGNAEGPTTRRMMKSFVRLPMRHRSSSMRYLFPDEQIIDILSVQLWKRLVEEKKVENKNGKLMLDGKSNRKFRLNSLTGIDTLGPVDFSHRTKFQNGVEEIHVESNQSLSSIYELHIFNKVKKILAANNQIEYMCSRPPNSLTDSSWPVKMKRLVFLDLSFNLLLEIPDLGQMPSLRHLNLSNNRIKASSFIRLKRGQKLEYLNLKSNDLSWERESDFIHSTTTIRNLTKLKKIKLRQNRFTNFIKDYHVIILWQVRSRSQVMKGGPALSIIGCNLEYIDDFRVDKSLTKRAEKFNPNKSNVKLNSASDSLNHHANFNDSTPNLAAIISLVDDCIVRSDTVGPKSSSCDMYIKEIVKYVNDITNEIASQKFLFQPVPDEFLQQKNGRKIFQEKLLNQFSERVKILGSVHNYYFLPCTCQIFSLFTSIQEGGLGKVCFSNLGGLMKTDEEHFEAGIVAINKFIVPQIKTQSNTILCGQSKALAVLSGQSKKKTAARLNELVLGLSNLTELLDGYKSESPRNSERESPLAGLLQTIASFFEIGQGNSFDQALSDEIIYMCAVACMHRENAISLRKLNILRFIKRELEICDETSKRYENLMRVIYTISENDFELPERDVKDIKFGNQIYLPRGEQPSAVYFGTEYVHKNILVSLRQLIRLRDVQKRTYEEAIVGSIRSIAAVCQCEIGLNDILDPRVGYLETLSGILNLGNVGPKVLSTVYAAVLDILKAPIVWFPMEFSGPVKKTREEILEEVTVVLQGVSPLLQFLDQPHLTSISPIVAEKDDIDNVARIEQKEACEDKLKTPVIFEYLVSIINLITAYCHEANAGTSSVAQRVAKDLDSHDREDHLFRCLRSESDQVRLAVVRCLLEVPLSELDCTEIKTLVEILADTTDVASGSAEEMLSGAIRLLTKMCLDSGPTGAIFRNEFGFESTRVVLSILERNEARDTSYDEIENSEKLLLSKSCVNFLQVCSAFPEIRDILIERGNVDKMIMVLQIEDATKDIAETQMTSIENFNLDDVVKNNEGKTENKSKRTEGSDPNEQVLRVLSKSNLKTHSLRHEPLLIEQTCTGRQVFALLRSLSGLSPMGDVAPRIMRRVANVLMGVPDPTVTQLRSKWQHLGARSELSTFDVFELSITGDLNIETILKGKTPECHSEASIIEEAIEEDEKVEEPIPLSHKSITRSERLSSVESWLKNPFQLNSPISDSNSDEQSGKSAHQFQDNKSSELEVDRIDIFERPFYDWVKNANIFSMNSTSARELEEHEASKEKSLPLPCFWNHSEGPTIGLNNREFSKLYCESLECYEDRIEQHRLISQGGGIRCLLDFLGSTIEKNTMNVSKHAMLLKTGDGVEAGSYASALTSLATSSIKQIVQSIKVPEVKNILLRLSEAKQKEERAKSFSNFGRSGPIFDAVSGSFLLNRCFMASQSPLLFSGRHCELSDDDHHAGSALQVHEEDIHPHVDEPLINPKKRSLILQSDHKVTDILCAGARIIYSLLRFGSRESIDATKKYLADPDNLKLVACILAGTQLVPVWHQGLLGAKFMAICYELCLFQGIQRNIDINAIETYAVITHVAKRILATIRHIIATTGLLSEEFEVIALYTTKVLALITKGLNMLELEVQNVCRAEMLQTIWLALIPSSISKGMIALLLFTFSKEGVKLDPGIREHITEFLSEGFMVCDEFRFEVLEEITREQNKGGKTVPDAYIGDLLSNVSEKRTNEKIQLFMKINGLFEG